MQTVLILCYNNFYCFFKLFRSLFTTEQYVYETGNYFYYITSNPVSLNKKAIFPARLIEKIGKGYYV